MMTQENPAYVTVKAMSNAIVTQKNRAYEEVIRIPPTMQHANLQWLQRDPWVQTIMSYINQAIIDNYV